MFEKPPSMPKKKNYYEFFGVAQNATEKELHRAYRRKARLYHPDIGVNTEHSKQLAEQFKQLQDVYSILKDPQKRARYDEAIRPKVMPSPQSNPERNRSVKPAFPDVFQDVRNLNREMNDMIGGVFRDFNKPPKKSK